MMFENLSPPYRVILADPPWRFETWSDKGKGRSPERHYKCMTIFDLIDMPARDLAHRDCVLFLWATWPNLTNALTLIHGWGFTYKTCGFLWVKMKNGTPFIGNGYWTRANTELCLLATRGHPKRRNADVSQVIIEPRREHSRKPDCIHNRIQRLVSGPYVELFARARFAGWDAWGDQLSKFVGPATLTHDFK